MRFASKYGRMVVQVQREITEAYATGAIKTIQRNIWAAFKPEGLRPFEREIVLSQWHFSGSLQEADEVTMVAPDYRIGVFDSEQAQEEEGWDDAIRERVEQCLLDLTRFEYILALPKTSIPAPWPKYDEFQGSVRQLLKKLDEDGHDLQQVLEYEQASQNRPALVEALQAQLAGVQPELEEETVPA